LVGDKTGVRLLAAANRLVELDPKNLDLRYALARLLVAFGNVDTAAEELKRLAFEFRDRGDRERAASVEEYLNRIGGSAC